MGPHWLVVTAGLAGTLAASASAARPSGGPSAAAARGGVRRCGPGSGLMVRIIRLKLAKGNPHPHSYWLLNLEMERRPLSEARHWYRGGLALVREPRNLLRAGRFKSSTGCTIIIGPAHTRRRADPKVSAAAPAAFPRYSAPRQPV